ncbi:hypothetical protein Tco_0966412 [Tanacetum coccineum]
MYAPTSELHLSTELMLNLPRYKGKDSEDKDMQKNLALIAKVLQETLQNIPTTTSVLLPNTRKKNDGLLIKVFNYNAEKSDWLVDTDEEIDEQELEAHYSYMAKIQEVYSDDQNDVECDDECVALANLIANLKLDVDENKKIQKQLKKANATLTQELTECIIYSCGKLVELLGGISILIINPYHSFVSTQMTYIYGRPALPILDREETQTLEEVEFYDQ